MLASSRASVTSLIDLENATDSIAEDHLIWPPLRGGQSYYSGNSTDCTVEVEDHLIGQKGF